MSTPRVRGPQPPRTIDLIDRAWKARGFKSSAQFAARLPSISESRLSNWRKGQGEPDVTQCREIAAVLGLTLAELLGEHHLEIEPDWRVGLYEVQAQLNAALAETIRAGVEIETKLANVAHAPKRLATPIDHAPPITPTRRRKPNGPAGGSTP